MIKIGSSNREIARILGVSEGTIKVHLHRIYQGSASPTVLLNWLPSHVRPNRLLRENLKPVIFATSN